MSSTKLVDLARTVSHNVALLTAKLEAQNAPLPYFVPGTLHKYPEAKDIQEPRQALIELAMDLYHLALGSANEAYLNHDRTTLEILSHFNVYQAVSLEGGAAYDEIAKYTKMPVGIVKRYLRHAFTLRIFEQRDGRVFHTAASAYAAQSNHLKAWVSHCTDEIIRATIHEVETIENGDVNGVNTCAWLRVFDPCRKHDYQNMFDYMENDDVGGEERWRERRFGEAMKYYTSDAGFQTANIHDCFDWSSFGVATIVDVGGSTGHLSFEIASNHLKLTFVVQDYASLEEQFLTARPKDLAERVSFQAHDYFTPQPLKNSHYLLKHILHDWLDQYDIKIIRNILPQLGPDSRIFVVHSVVPKHGGLPYFLEGYMTTLNLQMEVASRSKERSAEEWESLFKAADPSLEMKQITQPVDSAYALIEVVKIAVRQNGGDGCTHGSKSNDTAIASSPKADTSSDCVSIRPDLSN